MTSQNDIHLVWTVKKASEFVQHRGNNLRLAKCFLHLDCLDAKEWEVMLSMDSSGLQVHLCRSVTDQGPDKVEVDFQFDLLDREGDGRQLGRKRTRMLFTKDSSCVAKLTISSWEELLKVNNNLIVDDCVRISIRLWPVSQALDNPFTFYTHSLSVGVQRTVTCDVSFLDSMRPRKLGVCPVGTMRSDDSDLKVVVGLRDGKVCVRFTCDANCCVLLEAAGVVRADRKEEPVWKSEKLLRCDKPDTEEALVRYFPFLKVRKLTGNKPLYFPNDRLTLILSLTDYTNYSVCQVNKLVFGAKGGVPRLNLLAHTSPWVERNYFEELARDLEETFKESGIVSDLTLKVEGYTLAVHKNVLSAGSPVFESLIKSSESDVLEVDDFPIRTVFLLVKYVYTSCVRALKQREAIDLYSAAEKYGVVSLRDHCQVSLVSSLTPQTACRVLCLADSQSDERFKDSVLSYIRKNEKLVFGSAEWRAFMSDNPIRALEVSQYCHAKRLKLSN